MKRYLPSLVNELNMIVVIMKHQAEDVDMSGFSGPVKRAKKRNTTAIGGVGHHDIAHYIITLTHYENLKDASKTVYGQRVMMFLEKNAYGPPYRECMFDVIFDGYQDTPDTYDSVLRLGETTALWLVKQGLLGTRLSKGCSRAGTSA
jgi:RecA/RadA recombinase